LPTYAERVEHAGQQFKARNTASNPVFREVRAGLNAMCCGERRCAYCEDSCADEVEHVRPKALFPEAAFRWANYVYACGPCNGIKRSNFPRLVGGLARNVARKRGAPLEPPPAGIDLLIDPRAEDPAEFLTLDLHTGVIVPRPGQTGLSRHKAEQTIAILRLNRDMLNRARVQHRRNYVARLKEYLELRDTDECADADEYARSICFMGHPMVWNEIRRQHEKHPLLHSLFVRAPEALGWEPQPQEA
jgi:uncharacterized protein (TIGR02646 family)